MHCEAGRSADRRADGYADGHQDPLDPDAEGDLPFVVTRRQLVRLALVSSEVGARFQREGVDGDPMAWMLSPRRLFNGRDAVEATLEQRHCLRALIMHRLALGTDAAAADIDWLVADGEGWSTSRRDVRKSGTCGIGTRARRPTRGPTGNVVVA